MIVFGIAELGWSFRDATTVNTFARDYARDLSTGMTTTKARTAIENANNMGSGTTLLQNGLTDSNFTAYYSTTNGTTFTQPVGDDASGAKNNVPAGDLIMVTVNYNHSRLTGVFGTGTVPMKAVAIMVRQ